MTVARFRDRHDAGRKLASRLAGYRDRAGLLVLGLPRGGVPVAAEVAATLKAPLDVLVVRKLGLPGQPELAMGAIASGGGLVLNRELLRRLDVSPQTVEAVADAERLELGRRERIFRGDRGALDLAGKTVIVVDDGIATGATVRAAVGAVKAGGAHEVVVAVPVAPPEAVAALESDGATVVCLRQPGELQSVGQWYLDFSQTSDEEVRELLAVAD